ncbi:hypothetical protein K493DRAFT_376833 [Basidiobolus meristosporus CBS 931.73]|uniref:Uncharacterized protein n=1 Tax=Basidiobolus meristosporus CBS 931.73 TaxID=1314790 RepID=A0A1Y1Y3D0_9FUNG|nr:hypothetical protein K493DRAFT_376833 [Basidiobolus meristosporus CBS 931.73]|eukprot:ORX92489.1 hypothetical protein K493DRAFT_376833 [Basidiobolus meristosporus CBS 931.73]
MSNLQELVKTVSSLSAEMQEIVLFYVGDIVLYFHFFGQTGCHFEELVYSEGGPGFVLEEAIKSGHKPLLQWLLTSVVYPIDYLLTSAVCYGNLGILSYFISLIGEDYKEYDTPAKLLCILKGKLHSFEYLFQENPTFCEGNKQVKEACLVAGISKSSKTYSWYLRNLDILPPIFKEARIKACIQNDHVAGVTELVGHENTELLVGALKVAPLGSEKTYRRLITQYVSEADVLTMIARACVRLGYVDTLEILLDKPFKVLVEYDFFVSIPSLAVVKVLHRYASQRNLVSSQLVQGCIRTLKTTPSVYQTPECYQKLLTTFADSRDTRSQRYNRCWSGQKSEDVLLFLVDLAEVTSNGQLLQKYIFYGIESGHLRLLRKLVPLLEEKVLQSIAQGIAGEDLHRTARGQRTDYPNVYQSERPELVEYLFGLGIYQPVHLNQLMQRFDLKFIQYLVERGLVRDDRDGDFLKWDLETKRTVTQSHLKFIGQSLDHLHRSGKGYLMELIHLTADVIPYRKHFCSLDVTHAGPVSHSTCDQLTRALSWTCRWYSHCNPDLLITAVNSIIGMASVNLLLSKVLENTSPEHEI